MDVTGPVWDAIRGSCDAQDIAIAAADPDREDLPLVYVNRAFSDLTGYEPDEVLGRNCRFLQGPETADADRLTVREGIRRRGYSATCLLNYRKDGTPFFNMLVIDNIQVSHGRTLLLGCQFGFDRRVGVGQMQEQFQQTDSLLDDLEMLARQQIHDALLMRSKAFTAHVRAQISMKWVEANVHGGRYRHL